MNAGTTVMIVTTLILPFAFVVAIMVIKAKARNKQFEQLMEERRLMIEKGMEPPKLEMPGDPIEGGKTDPLANLKAGIIMIAMGIAASIAHYAMTTSEMAGALVATFALAIGVLRVVFLLVGPALIIIHFISRAYDAKARSEGAE